MNRDGSRTMSLNDGWLLRPEPLRCGPQERARAQRDADGWMPVDIPSDVRQPLIAAGLIPEPLEADASYASEWIEDRSWWFMKRFSIDADFLTGTACELVIDGLDALAFLFLNDEPIGEHRSAFYPFVRDVKRFLRPGENVILIRLTHGLEGVSDASLSALQGRVSTERGGGRGDRGDERRAMVRKPQFVYGWDWGPRVGTCGIAGNASLISRQVLAVRDVHVVTRELTADQASMTVMAEVESFLPCQTRAGSLHVEIHDGDERVAAASEDRLLRSGVNHFRFELAVPRPKPWWPNGMGTQHLYTLHAAVEWEGGRAEREPKDFGIRTLRLDQGPDPSGGHAFRFVINGTPVYARGANWIPADSIYARVSRGKYEKLVSEARDANFTMLRVWGGGIYEPDLFYHLCDQAGILVWQDFMFACAAYPDHDPGFLREVEREIEWQVRRLRSHPCLALLCGNNEVQWLYPTGKEASADPVPGLSIWNRIAPTLCNLLAPELPYWSSSPYGGEEPNASSAGDHHHWMECTMNADVNMRIAPEEYDKVESRFVTEYGYIGPCVRSTIERYFGGQPVDRSGRIWHLHNNTFEKETVPAGIRRHYADPERLDLDSYLLYGGLVQGVMLGYSLESLRANMSCSGALFWMYSDCWGEVGWSILDYYLKRKPSYYFVKRALYPTRLILRQRDDVVRVVGTNDAAQPVEFAAEYGYVSFDGRERETRERTVRLAAFQREVVLELKKEGHDERRGAYFMLPLERDSLVRPAILFSAPFRELSVPDPVIKIDADRAGEGRATLTVSSPTFAHAVHFDVPGEPRFTDCFFDLLPGEERSVTVEGLPPGLDPHSIQPCGVKRPG